MYHALCSKIHRKIHRLTFGGQGSVREPDPQGELSTLPNPLLFHAMTRKLCYRKDDRAMPQKLSGLPA